MRPIFVKIVPNEGTSWSFEHRQLLDGIPFEWHYHPEYELTLTLNSIGHRYIGSDVNAYTDGDLVLVGPSLPHSWCSQKSVDEDAPHVALVIKFSEQWARSLIALLPELSGIEVLFSAAAAQGVCFGDRVRSIVRPLIEAMPKASPSQRLLLLMEVLLTICKDTDALVLANTPLVQARTQPDDPRIARVLDHLHAHYTERLTASDIANLACVSVSAFHRMFSRHTLTTFNEYVVRLRLGRACALLLHADRKIADIAVECGYSNLSLFNRQFARVKGESPSQFRKRHRGLMGALRRPVVRPQH
jgi:AraC-like DNA-binding protein